MGKHTKVTVEVPPRGALGKPSEPSMFTLEGALPANREDKSQFHIHIITIVSFSQTKSIVKKEDKTRQDKTKQNKTQQYGIIA